MAEFNEEPRIHRQGACEVNAFVDQNELTLRKRAVTTTGLVPYYPASQREGVYDITYGEPLLRKRATYVGDQNLYCTSGLAGVGAEQYALYPTDNKMVEAAIKAQYEYIGLTVTGYNHSTDAADQGITAAVHGLHTTDKYEKAGEPGQIARLELPPPDTTHATTGKLSPSGKPLAKYQWRVVPEEYTVPGELCLTHFQAIIEDDTRWKQAMAGAGNLEVDKWLATHVATANSALMSGLLLIYVLMKMGYLVSQQPVGVDDPYIEPAHRVRPGGITNNMRPGAFVVRMAELLAVQEIVGEGEALSLQDQNYFDTLRRRALFTIFYSGKYRTFEFGTREGAGNPTLPTRDAGSGVVLKSTREGLFLHGQLNHYRIAMGAQLQALDDHCRFRVGRYVSGPNRIKRVNLILERTFM